MRIDEAAFFEALAAEMNANPERFERYGAADCTAALVMNDDDGRPVFCVQVVFDGVRCEDVSEVSAGDVVADFRLVGPLSAWNEMFDDVVSNGRATGLQTINSLALLGDRIAMQGEDPMGLDKFSRFNQTLQEFFDGAAAVAARARA